jgi:hypothetical protein
MSHYSQLPSVRNEVQDYFRSCERVLTASKALTPPFSKEEMELIEFYVSELSSEILKRQAQIAGLGIC